MKQKSKAQEAKSTIEQESVQTVPEKLLFTPISDLGLLLRTQNCLEKAGIEFICDLIQYNKSDFRKIHGLGPKGYHCVVSYLLPKLGLDLGMKLSNESLQAIETFKSNTDVIDNLKLDIRKINLLTRTKNCLVANGIYTVNALINTTKDELYKMHGFGRRSMADIEYILGKMDLKLADSASMSQKPDLSKIRIQDLRSLKCAKNPLITNGIDTVDKLVKTTKDEMYKIHGFGHMSMQHVEDVLGKMGLKLADTATADTAVLTPKEHKTMLDIKALETYTEKLDTLLDAAKKEYESAKKSGDDNLQAALKESNLDTRRAYIQSAGNNADDAAKAAKKCDSLSKIIKEAKELAKNYHSAKTTFDETNDAIITFLKKQNIHTN